MGMRLISYEPSVSEDEAAFAHPLFSPETPSGY